MRIGFAITKDGELYANMLPGEAENIEEFTAQVREDSDGDEKAVSFLNFTQVDDPSFTGNCGDAMDIIERLVELNQECPGSICYALEFSHKKAFEAGQAYQRTIPANEREAELLARIEELERRQEADTKMLKSLGEARDHYVEKYQQKDRAEKSAAMLVKEWLLRCYGVEADGDLYKLLCTYETVTAKTADVLKEITELIKVLGRPACGHLELIKRTERIVQLAREKGLLPAAE